VQRDKSGQQKKESERESGTHALSSAYGGTIQDTESERAKGTHELERGGQVRITGRMQACEGHSQTVERGGRDESGHGKKANEREALTTDSD